MSLKKNRLAFALISLFGLAAATACAAGASPAPTATTEPTATATPVPVRAIEIDPRVDVDGFLAALPPSEVDCASSAVGGRDNLVSLVSFSQASANISTTQLRVLASCISDETVERVVVGQLELQTGGLADSTVACISNYAAGIDFATLFGGQGTGNDALVSTLQAMFCLNSSERTALENSDQEVIKLANLGGIDALECAVDGAGVDGLAAFGNLVSPDGTVDPLAVGQFMPLLINCGVVDESAIESSAGVSPDQFSCLFQTLDSETLAEFMAIAEDPSATPDLNSAATLLEAMGECGLDLQEILDSAGNLPIEGTATPGGNVEVSSETLVCLGDNGVSASLVADFAAGLVGETNAAIAAALEVCGDSTGSGSSGEGVVVPNGNGGTTTIDPTIFDSLPITSEQAQCLIEEVGVEQLEGIAAGTTSPLAVLGALATCEITITDLLSGTPE